MKKTQEADADAETEHWRIFWLELQRTVAETQLFDCIFEIIVLFVAHREKASVHKRLDMLIPWQLFSRRRTFDSNRVPHTGVAGCLEVCNDIADLTRANLRFGLHRWAQRADLECEAVSTSCHHL